MRKKTILFSVAFFMLCLPAPAYAWLDFGHMAVACIAYQRLQPAKRERVDALLKLNPYYAKWLGQVSSRNRNLKIFMLAATWPDLIKGDPNYVADGLDGGDRPGGPLVSQNIGYSDVMMHKYWHFVDFPFASDATALPPVPVPNAQTQVTAFRTVLNSESSDELKSYDLVWLLHIVGDIHQPLHCTTRVSKAEPNGDNGGNNVELTSKEKVLHRFWDGAPGSGGIGRVPSFAMKLAPAAPALAGKSDPAEWIAESFHYAKDKVYMSPVKDGCGPFKLSREYRRAAVALTRERVELAGERLANLINNELK